ncbi:9968_t:CDS:2 [Funneliformis mosseae]|uniref:9968_t:CDS:1 n=1 Tax=Funneliformis mosseae TaxID=27381 RepID=A0A9N9CY07_FUNMO|nr:9968_t:CDS:2 [Funneliformis mosseae]
MFRMFLTRCSTIDFLDISDRNVPDLPLPYFAGAETSLSHLCELRCNMEIPPSIFYRMAQISSALATCSNTLTNLTFGGDLICIPSSTIAEIVNLQVLKLDFNHFNRNLNEEILESLEFTAFPNLKMLKMGGILAPLIMLGRLIRRTRNNLESISLHGWSKPDPKPIGTFNRVVAQYAPKLKYLTTCLDNPLDGDLLFEMLGNLCHEKFSKLRIAGKWTFTPKGLKKFFEKRKKKKRSFSLYICDCYDEVDSCIEITKSHNQVIERYKAEVFQSEIIDKRSLKKRKSFISTTNGRSSEDISFSCNVGSKD